MSLLKIIIGVVVVVSIAMYGFIHFSNQGTDTTPPPIQIPIDRTPVAAPPVASDTATPASDTSDDAIKADLSAVDAQIQGLSTDTANVDVGLNDKPVSQAQ